MNDDMIKVDDITSGDLKKIFLAEVLIVNKMKRMERQIRMTSIILMLMSFILLSITVRV